ncbi:hypothetical protein FWK35_00024985 [Aphis craccivora]|uniref:Uncharacterized protein n=1 Tax=Aphis craccivora TaxID=307492 RepID=A0A6G0ZDN2_APHCR|nr:hypothetical protein FWK35_00024985 [Aphis craccivora]
MYQLDSLS